MRVTAKPRWRRQAQTYFLNIDVVNNQSTTSSKTVKRLIDANELDLLAAELAQGPLATVLKHESSFGLRKPSPSQSDVNKRHRSLSKRHDHNRFERRSDKRRRSRSPSRPSTSHRRYVHSPIRPQSTHQKAHFARHDSESSSQFRNSSVCRRSLPVSNSNTSSSKSVQPNNFHRPRRSHYSHHNNDSISPSEHQRSVKRQQCQKSSALMKSHNLHTVEYNDSVSPRQKKGRYTNSLHKSALSPHHSTSTFIDDAAAKACAALARPLESAMTFNSNHTHHQSQKFQHHHHHHRHHHHHQQQHQQQQQLPQHKQQQQNHHHHHKNHHYSVTHKRMQDSISSTSSRMSRDSYTHTHTQTTSYTQLCATYPPSSSSSRTTQASLTSTITATPVVNKTYSASGTTCNVSQAVLDSLNLSRPATLTKTPVAAIPRQPSFLFRTIKMNPLMQEPKQPVFSQHNVPLKNITQTPRNHTSKKITRKKKNDAEKDLSYHHRIIENSGEDAISDDFIDDDDDDDDDVGGAMVDEDDEDVVSDDDDDDEDNDDDDGGGGMSSDEATTTLKKKLTTRKYNKRCGAGTLVCKVESTKENTEEIELVDKLIESLKYLQKRNRRSGHIIASRRAIARPTYLSCGLYADLDFPGNHLDKSSILPLPIGEGAEMLNHTVDFTLPLSMLHTHLVGRDLDTLRQHVGRSKAVPPPYIPVRNSVCASSFDRALMKSEPSQACNCPAKLIDGCGAQCVNRVTRFECMISKCRSGRSCTNQVMQRRQSVKLSVRHMGDKGWGLILEEDVRRGQFIIEYIGEIIDLFECERRLREDYDSEGLFYFLNFGNAAVVDATRYGNPARFTNHSCDPTACTQKWNVNGNLRVGIFARRDYAKGTEVTFDYMFERMGQKKQACLCGSTNCCGFLGSKKKSEPPPSDDEHETSSFTIDESEERIRYDSQAQMMQIAELIQHSTLPEWLERLTDQFTGSSSNPLMCARNIRHGFSRFKNRLRRFNIGV